MLKMYTKKYNAAFCEMVCINFHSEMFAWTFTGICGPEAGTGGVL